VRWVAVLDLLSGLCAIVLGVTLYVITREEDTALATLGLACRVAEGVVAGVSIQRSTSLLWLATATGFDTPAGPAPGALAALILQGQGGSSTVAATFFAVGSTAFSWLLLRGRAVPAWLAWLGVIASALLVVALPLRIAGIVSASVVATLWLPMAAFEIPLAVWLLAKGVAPPRSSAAARVAVPVAATR
jgi:hypothetical protein